MMCITHLLMFLVVMFTSATATNTDTTCSICPSGSIRYPGTNRCFARKWSGFLCNLDPATDPAQHHANDPKCVCSPRFCVAVGSQIKGVYSDVESARLRLGQFSQGYRMVCEMREQSAGVRAIDPHHVFSASGVAQHYSRHTNGVWNAWWQDYYTINHLSSICNNHAPCTAPFTNSPTQKPTSEPTDSPTNKPTSNPTRNPTASPTSSPTLTPTSYPSQTPTREPTDSPTKMPTSNPTRNPTASPTSGCIQIPQGKFDVWGPRNVESSTMTKVAAQTVVILPATPCEGTAHGLTYDGNFIYIQFKITGTQIVGHYVEPDTSSVEQITGSVQDDKILWSIWKGNYTAYPVGQTPPGCMQIPTGQFDVWGRSSGDSSAITKVATQTVVLTPTAPCEGTANLLNNDGKLVYIQFNVTWTQIEARFTDPDTNSVEQATGSVEGDKILWSVWKGHYIAYPVGQTPPVDSATTTTIPANDIRAVSSSNTDSFMILYIVGAATGALLLAVIGLFCFFKKKKNPDVTLVWASSGFADLEKGTSIPTDGKEAGSKLKGNNLVAE